MIGKLFKAMIRPGDTSLFGRVMSAGFWASFLRFSLRASVLVRTVILARLLSPEDFGLMGIATIAILFVERLTEGGIDAALIQKKDDVEPYLNTAFTMQILRYLFTAAVLVVAAPWIAGFFGAEEAENIIRVLAIGVAIKGFTNIGVVLFQRELRLDKYFVLEMAGRGSAIAISIILAFILRDVWALVYATVAGSVIRVIASYILHDFRPRLQWIWEYVKTLFSFGKWILASNVLGFISTNLDDIIVGRMLGVAPLGLYRVAYNLSQAVATEITGVANQVAFPTYSKLQASNDQLRAAYIGALHFVSFLSFPLAIGTILVAPSLVEGLLGQQWLPIIVPLQLLSIAGLMRSIGGTTGPLFQSQGRPDIPPRFSATKLVLMAILLVPAIDAMGLNGAAVVVAATGTLTGTMALFVAFRWVGANFSEITQSLIYPALNTTVMVVAVTVVQATMSGAASIAILAAAVAVGVTAYLGSVVVTSRLLGYAAPGDLVQRIRSAAAG